MVKCGYSTAKATWGWEINSANMLDKDVGL